MIMVRMGGGGGVANGVGGGCANVEVVWGGAWWEGEVGEGWVGVRVVERWLV